MIEASTSKTRRREDGFTLIELLIVLIIMGILLAILILSTRGHDAVARQEAMEQMTHEVYGAAVAFNADFPPVGGTDPLLNFNQRLAFRRRLNHSGAALPAAESGERDLGLFTKTGEPYFKTIPPNPYGNQVRLIRGATCPSPGLVGYVYICRSGTRVRVTGWARSREGTPLRVFDKVA